MKPLQDCQANVQSEFLSLTITVKGMGGETIKIKPCLTRKEALAKSRVISFGSLDELLFHGYRAIIPGNTPHNICLHPQHTHKHTLWFSSFPHRFIRSRSPGKRAFCTVTRDDAVGHVFCRQDKSKGCCSK